MISLRERWKRLLPMQSRARPAIAVRDIIVAHFMWFSQHNRRVRSTTERTSLSRDSLASCSANAYTTMRISLCTNSKDFILTSVFHESNHERGLTSCVLYYHRYSSLFLRTFTPLDNVKVYSSHSVQPPSRYSDERVEQTTVEDIANGKSS